MKYSSAIILPLKESFTKKNFGAVSVWVSEYLKYSKIKNNIIFCRKSNDNTKYLSKNTIPIKVDEKFYTNKNYIKKINSILIKKKINIVEIHNRPEYAIYLMDNNPNININLIFHNDPNKIRFSDSFFYKTKLLDNCKKIIFVSEWVKKKFFENTGFIHKNNTEIIYNFVKPLKKFPKKKNLIIFSGKLNKSKGFDIFASAITKILDKYKNWSAIVFGDEPREKINVSHNRLTINKWIDHKKLLDQYSKSSISVVNPTWSEPFGRTAMESASRGCAVITSKSGGLSETFSNNIILKKNNSKNLYNQISKLIENKKYLKKIQFFNYNNVKNIPETNVNKLDNLRKQSVSSTNVKNDRFKILHIGNFGQKLNHRLFNISLSNKISNGLIRNGNDVINYDYRLSANTFFEKKNFEKNIIEIVKNYRPNLILLGHNNSLSRNTMLILKEKYSCKISLWYEDHVIKGDPNYKNNLNLIEKNHDLIDQYFISTAPEIIKTKIKNEKLNYLPIPVDPNIENENFYMHDKTKDLFFALSHGVNYGKLKNKSYDERSKFIQNLVKFSDNKINFHILGLFNEQPKWNYDFYSEIMISKTALNLSRGGPSKHCSSNRIATLIGNGVLTFVNEKTYFHDFFSDGEIVTYKNEIDLLNKLTLIKDDKKELIKKAKLGKKNYFKYFENTIVADFIISKIFETKEKYKYVWYR